MKTILIKRPRNGELFEEIERQIVTDCKDEKDGFSYLMMKENLVPVGMMN